MNPDGSGQKTLIPKFDGLGLAISQDGKLLAFSSGRLNSWLDELFVMDIETHNSRRVTDKLHYVYNPAFSPNSKQIVVMTGYSDPHGPDHEYHISIVDISSAKVTQLTKGTEDWDPGYSPDGRKIVYSSGELAFPREGIPQKRDIYVIDTSGKNKIRLTNNVKDEYQPVFNPDGKKIAFVRAGNIFVMNANGTGQTQLTNTGKDGSPAYSPDGKTIVFESKRDDNYEIYKMNSDGTHQVRLTKDNASEASPVWK
jgi:TolB protein